MNKETTKLSPGLVWLMSIATGTTVASNYYAQPLLHTIAENLGLSVQAAGSIVTVAQVSYALGLLLLVPLGDMLERRALISGMTLLAAAGLFVSAFSPNLPVLLVGTAIAAVFSVVAQVLVPFAATLAAPTERGKVVGTVMSGLLLGVLLARTFSGLVATALDNWRAVYACAGVLMTLLAAVLYRSLPRYPGHARDMGYGRLLASIVELFRQEPVLRTHALIGALDFCGFAMLWTSMAFLLSAPPFNYSVFTIGLFGLAGALGALAASRTGRLADRGKGDLATRFGLLAMLLAWVPVALAEVSVVFLVIGVLALDMGAQTVHISNQNAIYRLRPEARSRLTAGYMTVYFIGGATGSLVSAWAYAHAGWRGVSAAGFCCAAAALLAWRLRPPVVSEVTQARL